MGKGFILAKTAMEASKIKEALSIEDEAFECIQYLICKMADKYPLLWKFFKDQYGDEQIDAKDLSRLKEEISAFLKNTNNVPFEVIKILKRLDNICKNGLNNKLNLYGVGD